MRLRGKVALITGTAGGQGRAAAELFAREGATVVGCDIQDPDAPVDLGAAFARFASIAEMSDEDRRFSIRH